VRDEVLVGKLPLRVDILLIRREAGHLPETSRRDLSVLLPLLNRFTLIEFKGPTDTLEPGTWHNWRAAFSSGTASRPNVFRRRTCR